MKNIIRTVAVAAGLGTLTSAAQARSSEDYLVREAHRIIDYSEDLRREVDKHFRRTSEYCHLVRDSEKIIAEAKHIDSLAHSVRSLDDIKHLKADVEDLDELVHHVAELIEEIERDCRRGHIQGDVRHVQKLVAYMNRSLHSMERLVTDMERRVRHRCELERRRELERRAFERRELERRSRHSHSRSRSRCATPPPPPRCENRSVGEQIAFSILREVVRHHR